MQKSRSVLSLSLFVLLIGAVPFPPAAAGAPNQASIRVHPAKADAAKGRAHIVGRALASFASAKSPPGVAARRVAPHRLSEPTPSQPHAPGRVKGAVPAAP